MSRAPWWHCFLVFEDGEPILVEGHCSRSKAFVERKWDEEVRRLNEELRPGDKE